MGSKETACTSYIHREVCVLKNDFLEAQSQVFNMTVHKESSDGTHTMIKLCDIPFIKPIDLECKYYIHDRNKYTYNTYDSSTSGTSDYCSETILRG